MKMSFKNALLFLVFLMVSIISVSSLSGNGLFYEYIDTVFLERAKIEDGKLKADSRSGQIDDFFKVVNQDILLKGYKASINNIDTDIDQSSNPFNIIFYYGIFAWIPYLFLELWLFYKIFMVKKHLKFSVIILFLILLQRPYLYNLYWTTLIIICIYAIKINDYSKRSVVSYA